MNKADTNELTEYWHRETRYVNDKVDEAFKDAQDHAYALGLKRGKEEVTDLAKRLVAARTEPLLTANPIRPGLRRQESDRTSQNLSIANLLEYLPAHFFWRRLDEALFAR